MHKHLRFIQIHFNYNCSSVGIMYDYELNKLMSANFPCFTMHMKTLQSRFEISKMFGDVIDAHSTVKLHADVSSWHLHTLMYTYMISLIQYCHTPVQVSLVSDDGTSVLLHETRLHPASHRPVYNDVITQYV